jgi:hypothetical protein
MEGKVVDPLKFAAFNWPDVKFYSQQRDIIYSVVENRETVVVAANKMGKDFVAAFIILWFFLTREPCRVVTTSVAEKHLNILWDEMDEFIQSSRYPLSHKKGGNLIVNRRSFEIRRLINGEASSKSSITGQVASKGEKLQGAHLDQSNGPKTMFVSDEASGVPQSYYTMADTWAHRLLIFGNAWPCENFFKYAVKGNPKTRDPGGDLEWA